jgi:hypothetical protein
VTTAWPANTILTDEGITDAVAGIVQTFTVTLFDSGNNQLDVGGDTLTITMTPTQSNIEIFDNLDGTYTV